MWFRFLVRLAIAISLLSQPMISRAGSKPVQSGDGMARQGIIEAPWPEYPLAARNRLLEGRGNFRLIIDRNTGLVTEVVVVKSTGHPVLDSAAVKSLRQWRFAPHKFDTINVPISFELNGFFTEQLRAARAHAIFAPNPIYPLRARFDWLQGSGLYQMIVDFDTGRVRDVKILRTTNSFLLDEAVLKAFRQWRFEPHSVRSVTTPVVFSFGDPKHTHNNAGL